MNTHDNPGSEPFVGHDNGGRWSHRHHEDFARHHHGDGPDFRRTRGGHGGPGGRRRGGRAQRGDVRAAVMLLLDEGPKHGYQLMQEMTERTGGAWRPSPGAVYPALSLLEDEGYVEITRDAGRKLVALTASGREHLEASRTAIGDPFAALTGPGGVPVRALVETAAELVWTARQVGRTGSPEQVEAAQRTLLEARRSLYLILADDQPDGDDDPAAEGEAS
jgi:DNA-binding PadR family transcriptional regulator